MLQKLELHKIVLALLPTLLFVQVCRVTADFIFQPAKPTEQLFAEAAPTASSGSAEKAPATVEPLPVRLAKANVEKGQSIAKKCAACHTFTDGGKTITGPNLYGVIDRPVASHESFTYSDAMKKKGGQWTYADLDHYLTNPKETVPGNKMAFAGISNPSERADLLAYLRSLAASPVPFPAE